MVVLGAGDFEVNRFIGRGCYSIVYEVEKTTGSDSGSRYALKRFFLENDSAVKCVLRERLILERLALADYQSPFLPVLFYSLWYNYSSAFVLREGAGCDLYDLLCHVGYLSETNARFYVAEVICGLEHLHSLSIVHLDIKPENVLFYPDGHVFVSDLDRSYDLTREGKPTLDDFTGTPLFMAPEVAKGEVIDVRADTWSLAALVAEMVSGPIRPDAETTAQDFQRARSGTYSIRGLKSFSKPLQSFFSACFQKNYNQRPYLVDIKKLRFLKPIDWTKVLSRQWKPPYQASEIRHRPAKEDNGPLKSTDQRVLSGAFSPHRPVQFASSRKKTNKHINGPVVEQTLDPRLSAVITPNLREHGYTLDLLNEKFQSFNFVHPCLRGDDEENRELEVKLTNGLCRIGLSETNHRANKAAELENIFAGSIKLVDHEQAGSPGLFRRTRRRGLSIGD
ncbi:Ribosomal protein S6 kinase alpha-6 [Fasciolopsis buskii]|uniref:Ribosomal protein S6 kinase alpha-6 n=1 Tax=Fasciolopsis buskii TaxID=27845 RepID=A0A8E0RT33_9TREM|nr:Ribosomal protein S6 kinase alpha-6 [Fasciolopsis buski]